MRSSLSFAPSGFFVLRTPLLPLCELTSWSEGLEAPAARDDLARLPAALAADRTLLRTRLAARLDRIEVREAVFLASPSLDESLEVWLKEPEGERGRRGGGG